MKRAGPPRARSSRVTEYEVSQRLPFWTSAPKRAGAPSPMTTSRHHQPSRVGQMVRRGRKGRHHHSLSLQVRFGTHLMAASGSARDGYVLNDRSEDRHEVGPEADLERQRMV